MNYNETLASVPNNFKIKSEIPHLALTLKHDDRRILYFYIVLLPFTGFALMSVWNDSSLKFLGNFLVLIILYVIASNVFAVLYVMWLAFGETGLNLENSVLTIHRKLFKLSKIDRINRSDMAGFYQIKDGGKGRDSFNGWGLKIKTNNGKKISVVHRQPIVISDWLGQLLSEIYNIEFYPTSERK